MLTELLSALTNHQNGTVNGTVNLIKENPKIPLDELALKFKISRRTVTRRIKQLQDEGIISRIGSDKSGFWQVNEMDQGKLELYGLINEGLEADKNGRTKPMEEVMAKIRSKGKNG